MLGFVVLYTHKNSLVVLNKKVRFAREGLVIYNNNACDRLNINIICYLSSISFETIVYN
jgi:hypothetical protein